MKYLYIALVLSIINIVFTLWSPILIGRAIDTMIGMGQVDFMLLGNRLILIGIATAIAAISYYFLQRSSNRMAYEITKDLRNQLFDQYHRLPLSYIDSQSHGDLMSRMISDIDLIGDGLLMGFTNLFRGVATIVGTIGFMCMVDIQVAMVVILLTPLSLLVSSVIATKTYKYTQEQLVDRGQLSGFAEEMIGHQKTVKAFSHEKENSESFATLNDQVFKTGVRSMFLSALVNPSTRFVNAMVYATVCLTGALKVVAGGLTVGALSSFLTYANQYTKPFNDISNVFAELQTALACVDRVFKVIDEDPMHEPAQPTDLNDPEGAITIEDLKFSYTPDKPLIDHFSLDVRPGMTIAIVGPTGCGKTTFINLMMRFYDPISGKISIDGVDIQDLTRNKLRSFYGMVLQDTWLFKGTIRDNIAFGTTDPTEEEIMRAAKNAHAHKFIKQLKGGYDAMLAEEGANLSQGQRQLLCIARIMLADPPMLILDEATSSIDTRTERQIQDAFDVMMKDRTTFIVAHRLSTIQKADQIIVMKDGHIMEQGTHDELLKENGFYHELYYSQFDVGNQK